MMKLLKLTSVLFLGLFIALAGCTEQEGYDNNDDLENGNESISTQTENDNQNSDTMMEGREGGAIAVLSATEGNNATGWVSFEKASGGVKVHAEFSDLPEGNHGFHVHLYGDCSAPDGTSAGTHFNFAGSSENPPADIDRITGNLGQVTAGANGSATADTTIGNTTIDAIMGRAVIVHAKGNDSSQPPIGAAGARLGCGVIGSANPDAMMNDNMEQDSMEEGN